MILEDFVKLVADMRKAQRLSDQNKGNGFYLTQKMKLEQQVDAAVKRPIKAALNNQKTLFGHD